MEPPGSTTASEFFGSMAASYDSLIRRAVPRYDEMTDRLLACLPAGASRVLELGCGTGNLTLRLAGKYPGARIVTADASAEMTGLTLARAGAAGHGARIEAVTARFEDLSFAPGSFDVVTSCLSLHHVRDKAPLYRAMAGWLSAGGVLRFADQFLGATPDLQRVHWANWRAFCREGGRCTEEEIVRLEEHAAAHDHYEALGAHFGMMARAGFRDMDCAWRNWMYAVVTAGR